MARIIRIGLSRRGGTKAGPDHLRDVPVAGGPGYGRHGHICLMSDTACGNDEFPTLPRSVPVTQRRHLEDEMTVDLFAGIPVTDYAAALPWYGQFFGSGPSFLPNDIEAVWEVAEHRYIYIVREPGRAGNALVFSFVDDLDDRVAKIARRGIEPD